MARKVGKINTIRADITMYDYMLIGESGLGKTEFLYEFGVKTTGRQDGLLILQFGRENGSDALPAFTDRVADWSDWGEVKETLIEERNTTFKNTKYIGIDSIDELFRLAEEEVVNMHNREARASEGKIKPTKSVNGAYGGYQNGQNKALDIVINDVMDLHDYGYRFFYIGHTKLRSTVDPLTGVEYEQLTNNLLAKYYDGLKDKVYLSVTAYNKRSFETIETVDAKEFGTNKKIKKDVGTGMNSRRVMMFRDTENTINTKSRLKFIPSGEVEFSADSFIKLVTEALEKQVNYYYGNLTQDKKDEMLKQQQEEISQAVSAKLVQVKALNRDEMLDKIKSKFAQLDQDVKESISNIVKKDGATNLLEASDKALESIVKLIG